MSSRSSIFQANILLNISDRYRPNRNPVRPITVQCRFQKNGLLSWSSYRFCTSSHSHTHQLIDINNEPNIHGNPSRTLILSSLSFCIGLFHCWIWTYPLLQIGVYSNINKKMTHSVDRYEPSHLGLHCLQRYLCWSAMMKGLKNEMDTKSG